MDNKDCSLCRRTKSNPNQGDKFNFQRTHFRFSGVFELRKDWRVGVWGSCCAKQS